MLMDIINELNTLSDNELTELETRLKITPDMRIHMSNKPIHKLEKRQYIQIPDTKPHGLWYGFGDEWIDWTEMANPERKGKYIYETYINGSNILQIKDCSEIEKFTKEYGSGKQIIPGKIFSIDWFRTNIKYDGIEINPYLDQARLLDKFLWYYSWDIASGCIWNLEKVKLRLLGLLEY
jgi:hypothetical protein